MSKRTLYAIFIGKFLFSISLIAWTITMTLGAGVGKDDDNTFMSYYHDVDDNFNQIMTDNSNFSNKYDFEIKINDFLLNELSYNDIYLSQRVISERKERKNILHIGNNKISIKVKDKITQEEIKNIDTQIVFTMPSTHEHNQELNIKSSGLEQNITLAKKSYWNIMGKIKIDDKIGSFYIKTNAL
jgi:hypothetical protein